MHRQKLYFWSIFVLSLALLFAPVSVGGRDEFGWDKLVHAVMFFTLILSAFGAFQGKKSLSGALLAVYAFASEYIQGKYLPRRHFDWRDIISDLAGLCAGLLVYAIIFMWLKRRAKLKNGQGNP